MSTDMATPRQTYSRSALYQLLDEIQRFLAELRYIDRALAYLDEQQQTLGDQMMFKGYYSMTIAFGETVPFTRTYEVSSGYLEHFGGPLNPMTKTPVRIEEHLAGLAEEASTWALTNLQSLRESIEEITYPSVSTYGHHVIEPLLAAHRTLEREVSTDFGKLKASLGSWKGQAAEAFTSFFYTPFELALTNQKQLLLALAGGLVVARQIVAGSQQSLLNVVHYTRECLHEQLVLRKENDLRSSDVTTELFMLGLAATFLTAGSGSVLWGLSAGTVTGAAAAGAEGAARESERQGFEFQLYGRTAEDLLYSLKDAVDTIARNIDDAYEELKVEMNNTLNEVELLRRGSGGKLIPIELAITDGTDSRNFRHESSSA